MGDLERFLERNRDRFLADSHSLLVNLPAEAATWIGHDKSLSAHGFFQDFAAYRRSRQVLPGAAFGAFPTAPEQPFREVVLVLPREKALFDAWLNWITSAISADGTLWVAGENRAGARSADRLLKQRFHSLEKVDSARHCSLYRATGPMDRPASEFQPQFTFWDFDICGRAVHAASLPGVFSHGRLDAGTRLLLETLASMHLQGNVLDFGCGAGVISAWIGSMFSSIELTLVDSSGLALASSRRTLELNRVEGQVAASDGLCDVSARYDLIISNPPFHQGVHTKSGMSMSMLQPVRNFLEPGGQLVVVVNRHLPYRAWMQDVFSNVQTLSQNDRFSVLQARN